MKFRLSILVFSLLLLTMVHQGINGQNSSPGIQVKPGDSITLPVILRQVMAAYPTVLKAEAAIASADAGIGMARTAYYPNIEANAGYTRLGPVSQIDLPFGSFQIYPADNYNLTLNVAQTIYDFSKTSKAVDLEKSSKEISVSNVELVRQRLTLQTSVCYYSLVYLQEAIKIKETQIGTLKKHLDFIQKKEETGSTTEYEVLSTKVRLSNAENQKVDLETARKTQQAILCSLTGLPVETDLKVMNTLSLHSAETRTDSLISYALLHRYEMILARLREEHASLHLRSVKAQNMPVLNAYASGGWKNGYLPNLNTPTGNYAAGVGIRVPIFDATRRKNNIGMVNAEINITRQETENASREISTEVYQNQTSLNASVTKIKQSELQVEQAEQAFNLAATSFKAGVITNLDLLDSETALEESRVNLLKAKTDYAINQARLAVSLGKPVN